MKRQGLLIDGVHKIIAEIDSSGNASIDLNGHKIITTGAGDKVLADNGEYVKIDVKISEPDANGKAHARVRDVGETEGEWKQIDWTDINNVPEPTDDNEIYGRKRQNGVATGEWVKIPLSALQIQAIVETQESFPVIWPYKHSLVNIQYVATQGGSVQSGKIIIHTVYNDDGSAIISELFTSDIFGDYEMDLYFGIDVPSSGIIDETSEFNLIVYGDVNISMRLEFVNRINLGESTFFLTDDLGNILTDDLGNLLEYSN